MTSGRAIRRVASTARAGEGALSFLWASVVAERMMAMTRRGPGARREVMVVVGSKVGDVLARYVTTAPTHSHAPQKYWFGPDLWPDIAEAAICNDWSAGAIVTYLQ